MANTTITVQPMAAQSTTMLPAHAKIDTWSTSLCDCCDDMSVCCFACWCPCCMRCSTTQDFGECGCLPVLDFFFGWPIYPTTFAMRAGIRERYRIQGTMCDDCCVASFCGICAWCQMARELKLRRKPQVIVNTPVTVSCHTQVASYQPVVNLAYNPPPVSPAIQQQVAINMPSV